jgi:peroxiredoxin
LGKVTVIKTWFIACKPCIAEMPELNEFVHHYRNKSEIQFLSLATDTQASLEDFLKKRRFDYKVFPEQKELIQGQLNLSLYPTHLVVDKNGHIKKVFNKASELMTYIEGNKSLFSK